MGGTVKEAHLSFADRLLRYFSYCLVKLVHRPKVCGPLPPLTGPTIFACRHVGLMDPVILMVVYFRHLLHPLVAKDYYEKNKFVRGFYDHAQCIPIDRKTKSKQWLEDSVAALGRGESIIIFPEGRRNKNGEELLPFRRGVAMLAAYSGAQVVPVYNGRWKFPRRYRLAIGEPVSLDPLPAEGLTDEWILTQCDKIRSAVAALGPLVNQ